MAWPKGQKRGAKVPGSGRKPNTANKFSRALKDVILGALGRAGGEDYLLMVAQTYPAVFVGLVGRVLPLQVKDGGQEPRVPKPVVVELHQGPPPKLTA